MHDFRGKKKNTIASALLDQAVDCTKTNGVAQFACNTIRSNDIPACTAVSNVKQYPTVSHHVSPSMYSGFTKNSSTKSSPPPHLMLAILSTCLSTLVGFLPSFPEVLCCNNKASKYGIQSSISAGINRMEG